MTAVITDAGPGAQSARAILEAALATYGLSSLASWAWERWLNGQAIEQIFLDLKATPEYKARFPAMATLAGKGRAISEAEYINIEGAYTSLARQYGLPTGFYDQADDFAGWIAGEVSPAELSTRLQQYQALVYDVDPTVRAELNRIYGISDGDIAAYWIDPNKALPFLSQKFGAAQTAGASQRSGFGALSQGEAELYGNLEPGQAAQGFGLLAGLGEVTGQLVGESEAGMARDQSLAGVLGGNQPAQAELERRARSRRAVFEQGGGFATSRQGVSGAG